MLLLGGPCGIFGLIMGPWCIRLWEWLVVVDWLNMIHPALTISNFHQKPPELLSKLVLRQDELSGFLKKYELLNKQMPQIGLSLQSQKSHHLK